MPSKMCGMCERIFDVTPKSWLEIPFNMDYLCSAKCVYAWIKMQSPVRLSLATRNSDIIYKKYVLGVPSEVHSQKLDTFYRSKFESCFAEACADKGFESEYECVLFKVGNGTYTPDFYFPKYGCFVEIKGQWGLGQKGKMTQFIKDYPMVPIVVVPWTLRREFGYVGQRWGDYIQ